LAKDGRSLGLPWARFCHCEGLLESDLAEASAALSHTVHTGTELLAACLPAYALLQEGGATSCDGGLAGLGEAGDARIPELIGVACVGIVERVAPLHT